MHAASAGHFAVQVVQGERERKRVTSGAKIIGRREGPVCSCFRADEAGFREVPVEESERDWDSAGVQCGLF